MIDLERLEHDLDYWDECDPTGGEATHFREDSTFVVWYRISGGNREYLSTRIGVGWVGTESSGGKFIPRPTRKQWSGPEDGLPPVGVECEFTPSRDHYDPYPISDWIHGDKIEVVAHKANGRDVLPVVYNMRHQSASLLIPECIQPLKSEKERVVDYWSARIMEEDCDKACEVIANLYDLGALKMPEEDQ